MTQIRHALEQSWGADTAYLSAFQQGNPALGNCYPSSRVVQHYFPDTEIVEREVQTPSGIEIHFWNILITEEFEYHIDFTWGQFPDGSYVTSYRVRDRSKLNDDNEATVRVQLLLDRVQKFLKRNHTTT